MSDFLGPADAANAVTVRPAEARTFLNDDTWMKDCTSEDADDGTDVRANWFNGMIAVSRNAVRMNGKLADNVTNVVLEVGSDDDLLKKSVQQLVQRGQPLYGVDTGGQGSLVVSLTPTLREYKAGMQIVVKVLNDNLGPSRINIDGLGYKDIRRRGGAATLYRDLVAGDLTVLRYDGAVWQVGGGIQFPRTRLEANLDLYIATTGSDANDGHSPATPFLTKQAAWNYIAKNLDVNGYQVTIHVADGTYTDGLIANGAPVGQTLPIFFVGNDATPNNVQVNSGVASCFSAANGAFLRVSGFRQTCGANVSCVQANYGGIIYLGNPTSGGGNVFGPCGSGSAHISTSGGSVYLDYNYYITGGAGYHFYNVAGVITSGAAITCFITGNPAFTTFVAATGNTSAIGSINIVWNITGAVTGVRYAVNLNGVINTQGQGPNYFPGNAPGTVSNGGQYV
ncbi:hypothetical protein FNL56_13465 [Tardiphaga sp. vice304]|uniref:hypothetical protein n=1 Tax=Tardiphaga sp. vice304 TaxID=2592817 RepID=UPI0011647CB1|nr:hypothetical protein [Tardiphaga sp. vice304]QDM27009.1 hypothetical protein FNL56_13465 [Tardiphaga sp. vice304]